jgi:hypothetical protein
MAYTQFKRFSVQAQGSNSGVWGSGGVAGDDLNTGVMLPLDGMLAGLSTFSLSASPVSLTFTAGGGGDVQNCMFRFTGALLANIVVSPAVGDATTYFRGFYMWENVSSGNFSVTVTTAAGSAVLPQGRRGIMFVDATNGPRIVAITGSATADPIPAGTVMPFYQPAAPAGWTAVALNDYAIKIVSNGNGGVTSGSVAYSTLFGRTATDAYALQVADLAPHTHNFTAMQFVAGPIRGLEGGFVFTSTTGATTSTGSGTAHSHNIDMRVNTAAFVLASRN